MGKGRLRKITIGISDDTYKRLKKYADEFGESVSDVVRNGITYVMLSEEEEREPISLAELTEYELGLVTNDILKKYCSNCAEEIKYPKPGRRGAIWKEIEISVDKTDPEFVTTGEFYLCENCIELKEKRCTNKESPKDEDFKKYCRNCGERISYPKPGEHHSIWCLFELIADRKGLNFVKVEGVELYFCHKCVRVKEERHKDSPMDNLVYETDEEEWERIVNQDRFDRMSKRRETT